MNILISVQTLGPATTYRFNNVTLEGTTPAPDHNYLRVTYKLF